ncbi:MULTISPECIES: chromate transporter [unclassified Paenibacillus]|uniref:chromate transporter n=1 Tax=unclassified Paenibacillus TaxID=185978 RepID=UPI0004F8284F|nr:MULTISPECIES: chromate transporter [unclassified Paenibacillus]AIQ29512.1 ChrA protein [Paenibacillus sp. FSL P4-0081]OMF26026.1 ChrA protein [Paenibacillus sp. FSL H8-0259]
MQTDEQRVPEDIQKGRAGALLEVLLVSAKLGLTSFGGPIAHLGYFHNEYIRRRKWMDERSYADLVALCQFLPGPASSQVGIGIGVVRAGLLGGVVAWLGFTLPSVIALVAFAFLLQGYDIGSAGWIHGLKIVAVAVVAHAILGMGQKLTPDRERVTIAVIGAAVTLSWQTAYSQVLTIAAAGIVGVWLYRKKTAEGTANLHVSISRTFAILCLLLFFGLLVALPLLRGTAETGGLAIFDSFYRSGSLVFGGGHVVLPLLEREVVPSGWVSQADFLAGYGATQAVPGPLFTFASYLGALTGGVTGAIVATSAIFLPAFLLVVGALPFWNSLRKNLKIQGALAGINAAVVGLLLAALYDPLWTSAIVEPMDFALAAILFIMLVFWKLPPWVVVVAGSAGGMLLGVY